MPELAEVEFYRKEWAKARGWEIVSVALNARARVFRDCDVRTLERWLPGARMVSSEAHGKKLLFRFCHGQEKALLWLGIHLGMSGKLRLRKGGGKPEKHDHLVLVAEGGVLIFTDPRQFGRVRFAVGEEVPEWWRDLPPEVLSAEFTRARFEKFLEKHRRTTIKAVLLMQEGFPGLGNWMVDEILWQARIYPAKTAGSLGTEERKRLFRAVRSVCRTAMNTVGRDFRDPPRGWLFHHRWRPGGICPKTRLPLVHEKIAGRTTCWSPAWQEGG